MRTRIQALIELREIVTTLYKDKASIGRILSDAGLDVRRFNFEGNLIDVWHRILEDVENQECLPELIYAIQQEYPKNKTLQNAWLYYCQTVETKPSAGQSALDENARPFAV